MELPDFHNMIPHIDSVKSHQTQELLIKIRQTYNKLNDLDLGFALYKISENILKIKSINPQIHQFLEECIKDVIRISVSRGFAVGTEALRIIFNTDQQYYKHSKLDSDVNFPLGLRHPLNFYLPEVGQECDIVRPYISAITYCGWTRGIIISREGNKYLVKYANCQTPSQTKQRPFCSPLGSRTQDFEWRMSLKEGDQLDAYHKGWFRGTVVKLQIQNGVKRIRVTFKTYSENGKYEDRYGKKYDGFIDQQDEWYEVTSYRIQKPDKMSRGYCQYSLVAEEAVLDDTFDLIFQKEYQQQKFRAIMRNNYTRSLSFIEFYETFCDMGGNTVFFNLLENYNKDYLDPVYNGMVIVGNCSFLIPKMRTKEFLPQMIKKTIKFLYDNSKTLNQMRNEMSYFFIDITAKRIMTLSEKHQIFNDLRKRLALDFLKMNMQKQMTALRFLYELISPIGRKYTEQQRQQLNQFLKNHDIFYQIVQSSTHEQILVRSVQFIRYLLTNKLISFKEIQYLWNIFPATDLRGRSTVQKMIGEISKIFQIQDTKNVIQKILRYKESELTVDNLGLLRNLKDHKQLDDLYRLKILQYLWQVITLKSMNITEVIEEEVQKVFKSIIPTLTSNVTKLELLKLLLSRLQQLKQLNNQFDILKDFILTYPKNKPLNNSDILKIEQDNQPSQTDSHIDQVPQCISEVVEFLKHKNIYQTIVNIFNQLKNIQKMKNVLWFTSFLFQNDKDDVNQIVKTFYEKIGPSDIFLDWAQNITSKSHQFFIYFFSNLEGISKFTQLSNSGYEALKTIIFDVNIREGNLKIIKKNKGIAVQADNKQKNKNTNDYSVMKGPVYGPEKPDTLTFLYLLKSPYECKGVMFLQQLLCVVKNSKVYDEIIKLIIQFFVNLDESILDRTKQFREQFLMDVIQRFKSINERNQYNDQIKLKLEISINLLQQLFAQTQKQGLLDIRPHFQCVEGQIIRLKIQNHITSNKIPDFKLQINQNATFFSLKVKLAQIFKEKAQQLNVYKFVNPIADQLNAKSVNQLHFFNDEGIKVMRKSVKDIPRKQLLSETGEYLSPKFESIVQNWFNSYKNQKGQMGIQQLKKLSGECWKGSLLKEISKLNEMLKKFDVLQKGYLNLQEFKQFFIVKSAQNTSAIWRIINLSGYNNNLKHKDQPQDEISADIYPRRILSNPYVYQVIFAVLENKTFQAVHLNFYRLLSLLETDKNIKEQVKRNAKSLIQDQISVYKLSYILETILSQILTNDEFYVQFYKSKGCEFIFHKLLSFMSEDKSIYAFDTLVKTIVMPNMIKILNAYLFCIYSQNKLIRYIKRTKINQAQIDLICHQVKKIDEIINQKNQFEEKRVQLKSVQCCINSSDYHQLAQKIFFNLINNFSSDLLSKLTNQIVRMYSCLSLSLNSVNREGLIKAVRCESLNFRRSGQNLAYLYLLNNKTQVKSFLSIVLENIPQQSKAIFSNYFSLLQKVLQIYLDTKKDSTDETQFIELTQKLFKKLFQDLQNEMRNSVSSDKLLLGVLVVINTILIKRRQVRKAFKHLKKDLLQKCLFFYQPKDRIQSVQVTPEMLKTQKQQNHFKDYVKCKSQDTRKVLMEIIFHLHEVSAQQDPVFIDQYILPIFNDLPKQKRKFETKSLQVGLNNLGSTCYLNSMLQVLNSVGPFRNKIVQCNSDARLVKQMKALFSYLFFSQRQDYIPEQLLQSFVPPILKGIQQDTTEFLNILLDQLDSCLKGTSSNNLLEQIFQGSQAAQMICHACGQKRERKQTFFTYGVEIQGKYDLNSALQGMNTGQLIADCFCQNCGQKSDTTKRTVIDAVPNIFFIHLKRIVFNYDVFMNTKIHTRLQFPNDLNFEPYTKQGLELRQKLGVQYMKNLKDNEQQKKKFEQMCLHGKVKDYYKLKLKGIIVHSGGPQVGHYWAITKKDNGWVKFDDSRVTIFPVSSMQSECYGGNFQSDEWGGMGSSTNAYVLLYQKQLKSDLVLGEGQNKKVIPFDKCQTFNTIEIYKQVWLDNHSLMLQNHLLRDTYCRQFIHFLVQMLKITPSNSKIQVICETLYKVCFHSGQTGKLIQSFIENTNQITPQIFRKYVLGQKLRTLDLLFHNNANVRDFSAVFIQKVLIETFKIGTQQDKNQVLKLIDQYLYLLHNDVAKSWLRIDGYFRLFEGLVVNSLQIKELHNYLIEKHLISYFIDFIMQKASPINVYPKKYSVGTKSNPANFGYAIGLIFFLIKRSYGLTGQNYEVPTIDPNDLYHLSDNDVLCLSHIGFYQKMLKQRQNLDILGLVIQRLSIKNLPFSEAVARVMLIALNQITDAKDQMIDICNCISKYVIITDQYWVNRAEFIFGYSSPYIFNDNLLSSLDEERFVYYSTLEDLFPVECLLAYCHVNRLRNPLSVLHILKTILEGCHLNQISRQYLLSQKSPSYHHQRYLDWVKPYVNGVVETLNLSKQKKQTVLKQVQICNMHIFDLQKAKKPINSIITGKILNSNIVDRIVNEDNSIEVVISNVETYTLNSEPTGFGNAALDKYIEHGRLNKKTTKESNILCFFKQFSKPLAIKQAVEQAEQKQLLSLFDDCIDKKTQQTKIQQTQTVSVSEQSKQNIKIEQNKQQPVKQKVPQQPKEQDIIQQINIEGVKITEDYFRKLQIINNSTKTKRVTLKFHKNMGSNMIVPSKIYFSSTRKAVQTMWICKQDAERGWGSVDYQLIVDEKETKTVPKCFKLYGQTQNKKNSGDQINSETQKTKDQIKAQPLEIQTSGMDYNVQKMQIENYQQNYPVDDGMAAQINCPVCTYLNLATESNCEVCGSSLR